jgi:2-dehydro-3-deoxyphosphogluconate aldolase / (4S)-4-hydroxy-2-oxoglutarate aldolase
MTKLEIRARIEEIGLIPAARVSAPEHALYAAEAVNRAGIPIVEITNTVPNAIGVIAQIAKTIPGMIVGAGTVLDADTAARCIDAGAMFITSPGLVMEVVEYAVKRGVLVFPGAMTPTEVIAAWKAGADFVKIFPCAQVDGPSFIRALKVPLPQVGLIASGGVDQQTAYSFILAGASALGLGSELIPHEALEQRRESQIRELARRFLGMVKNARAQLAGD